MTGHQKLAGHDRTTLHPSRSPQPDSRVNLRLVNVFSSCRTGYKVGLALWGMVQKKIVDLLWKRIRRL